jgi:hypothetical protein
MWSSLRAIGVVFLVILALPVALIGGLWQTIMGGASTSSKELAAMLRKVAKGRGNWDDGWDELDSVPLRDDRLEAVRLEACKVPLPLTSEGRLKLVQLAERAERE